MNKWLDKRTHFIEVIEGEGLKVPVIDMSLERHGKYLSEPETIRYSILGLIYTPEELESLVIVKPDKNERDINQLDRINFGDDLKRHVIFSSGNNVYFGDRSLVDRIRSQFFSTKIDHACRYGSLLTSSCINGVVEFSDREDDRPLRVKIVDSQSDNLKQQQEAAKFFTGDCHGKISLQLARQLGGGHNQPFQFRFAWMQEWAADRDELHTPQVSFLAKGTFLPNAALTEVRGYDIILDRSSIKGIEKKYINKLVPCGDYQLPKAIIGNRANAQIQEYQNSWQFLVWFSREAIERDIVPAAKAEAQKLAEIQKDPLALNQYLIEQSDRRTNAIDNFDDSQIDDDGDTPEQTRSESRLLSILRHDRLGLLAGFPKLADFQRSQLQKRWLELAFKGAARHDSAMAQPCDSLKPGTIVAPYLEDGQEVIITRYPIVSKDNIRRYTVDNSQAPSLLHYKGCIFIHPDRAMEHHQCDFDGDQLIVTPAERFPHIAREIRHADEEREYSKVQKRAKVDYAPPQYKSLRQIAVAIEQNSIGYIANLIGRVQSSVSPALSQEKQELFEYKKRLLLGKLFDALQIEVDGPKSATRFRDYHPKLEKQARAWIEKYPSYLFDYKKNPLTYKSAPIPTESNNPINCIAEQAVNPHWQRSQIQIRERHHFNFLFAAPTQKKELDYWQNKCLPWAEEVKERYKTRATEIYQAHERDSEAIKREFAKFYEDLRAEIDREFPSPKRRLLAANALWQKETTNANLDEYIRECKKLSRQLKVTFHWEENHQRLHDLLPKDTWIFSVPFERYLRDKQTGAVLKEEGKPVTELLAQRFKEYLDKQGAKYEATTDERLPLVRFALIEPNQKLIEQLQQRFGENVNEDIDRSYYDGRGKLKKLIIVPPKDCYWVETSDRLIPKASLTFRLFTEEVCKQLEEYKIEQAKLIGQKFNDYATENFNSSKWKERKLQLTVAALDHPEDRRHGLAIVQLKGKNLAMFAPESPSLPIGATFTGTITPANSALILNIAPESVRVLLPSSDREQCNSIHPTMTEPTETKISQETSFALHQAIKDEYRNSGFTRIAVGDWVAKIRDDRCRVQDKNRLVFQSDLDSDRIIQPLSDRDSQIFIKMAMISQTEKVMPSEDEAIVTKQQKQLETSKNQRSLD
jgi:hypothetical protein